MAAPTCPTCNDTAHVCDEHPDRPWGAMCCDPEPGFTGVCRHGACHCSPMAMPCRVCCSPLPEDGSVSILLAFIPDRDRPPLHESLSQIEVK